MLRDFFRMGERLHLNMNTSGFTDRKGSPGRDLTASCDLLWAELETRVGGRRTEHFQTRASEVRETAHSACCNDRGRHCRRDIEYDVHNRIEVEEHEHGRDEICEERDEEKY